jgi:pantoate--beta-alanine ligase
VINSNAWCRMPLATYIIARELRQQCALWRRDGLTIGFVPTMGALHEGHISLIHEAAKECDRIVVSVFVNPMQFGPKEDFSRYPRTLNADLEKLASAPCHGVFLPTAKDMYPEGFQTSVINKGSMAAGLCGSFRPGHFEGVLTVVCKLFNIVQCDHAFFGKKDYQQWRLIESMVQDLAMPLKVSGVPTLREEDGLAMSSRNRYLSAEQRVHASLIFQGMQLAKDAWIAGERGKARLIKLFQERIALCPEMTIQYCDIVDAKSLKSEIDNVAAEKVVMIVAVLYGDVRLIDNLEFFGESV